MSEKFSYEAGIKRLEELVSLLESGKLTLEDSIKAYEEGKTLSRSCLTRLQEAQNKIQVLIEKDNGQVELSPFEPES